MKLVQTPSFARKYKKLPKKIVAAVDDAIRQIAQDTKLGEMKHGDLGSIRIMKIKSGQDKILIAYAELGLDTVELIDMGSHENFYRDLKRKL